MALLAIDSQIRDYKWLTNCLSIVSHGQRVAGRGHGKPTHAQPER